MVMLTSDTDSDYDTDYDSDTETILLLTLCLPMAKSALTTEPASGSQPTDVNDVSQ
jgi:hypothetical protein